MFRIFSKFSGRMLWKLKTLSVWNHFCCANSEHVDLPPAHCSWCVVDVVALDDCQNVPVWVVNLQDFAQKRWKDKVKAIPDARNDSEHGASDEVLPTSANRSVFMMCSHTFLDPNCECCKVANTSRERCKTKRGIHADGLPPPQPFRD